MSADGVGRFAEDRFAKDLAERRRARQRAGLWRELESHRAPELDFATNDYLGLASASKVCEAIAAAVRRWGAGARAARLLGGGSPEHEACERAVAAWLGDEAGLLFPSGYQANVGLIGSLVGRGDVVLSDRDNHASLIDGARLSRARVMVYDHLDLSDLETALQRARAARRRLVVTESVFSMAGDLAPLAAIAELCARHDAWLLVDEAHAVGLLGREGAGAWADVDTASPSTLCARVVTGGKALGVGGAVVVGSRALRQHVANFARSFMFTTAPPPALAAGLRAAVDCCREMSSERERVLGCARELALRLDLPEPGAAIVPIPVGDADRAVQLAGELRGFGMAVPAVRPPTVAPGASRLRAVCHAGLDLGDVHRLAEAVQAVGGRHPVASSPSAGAPRPVVVVGTDTGIGKTVVSAMLVRALHAAGREFAYWKPVQTGDDDDTATVRELAAIASDRCLANHRSFPLPASPHEAAADQGERIDVALLDQVFAVHRAEPARKLVVELAGGLQVPYTLDPVLVTQADWVASADVEVVLVARSGLGTLNHTLLTLEALRLRRVPVRALFLVGDPHVSNRRTLERVAGVPAVFEVPRFDELCTAALDGWLADNPLEELLA